MNWTATEKELVIKSLLVQTQENQELEVALRMQGKSEEADQVWASNQRLSVEIDILIGKCMEEWKSDAERVTQAIDAGKQKIQDEIREIKRGIDIAQNVVKVIGYIDDLISLARGLV